jgi:hypothetical protein
MGLIFDFHVQSTPVVQSDTEVEIRRAIEQAIRGTPRVLIHT